MSKYRVLYVLLLIAAIVPQIGLGFGNGETDAFIGGFRTDDAASAKLRSNAWYWQAVSEKNKETESIQSSGNYALKFEDDGSVAIKADCNRATGRYVVDGNKLTITVGPTTMMACPGNSLGEKMIAMLSRSSTFVATGSNLIIVLNDESVIVFRPPTIADKCGDKATKVSAIADTLDPKVSSGLDQLLVGFVTSRALAAPGASMLVVTPSGRFFKAVGVSDVATCSPLKADSPFQIGSNTKMMTSAIILQLVEQKKLALSDPLSKFLPEIASKLTHGDNVNIEMLLTHTSGIPDYFGVNTGGGKIEDGVNVKAMLTRGFTPGDLVELVARSGKSDFLPGEAGKWNYSNTGYVLLGMIIEKVTKKSYERNLRDRIFKPLGLKSTYLQVGQPVSGNLPQAYYQAPFSYTTTEWNASQGWSAGAVVSTSEEFAKFLKALFTGKLFKKPATLELMKSHSPAGVNALGEGTAYGHGMLNNRGVLGHGGQTLGFQSDGGYIPDKDVTIVIWSNSATSMTNRLVIPGLASIVTGEK